MTTGKTFRRGYRLTEAAAFTRVFEDAVGSVDHLFTVLARPNELQHPRLGLAVSRKVARRAVGRNRLKRLIRESFRQVRDQLPGVDIVVLAKPAAAETQNTEVLDRLDRHWRRIQERCARFS